MLISEVFESIHGEGPWAGTRSLFIRTSGCNLRCWFCDTPYTSWQPESETLSVADLRRRVQESTAPDVVLTGGEPLLSNELPELATACRQEQRRITIETAGTVFQELPCDLMAISPKLKNSVPTDAIWGPRHERSRHRPDVMQSLLGHYNCILKFVIDQTDDLDDVEDYLREFPEVRPEMVWLMPQARTREQLQERTDWVREAAQQRGFQFSSRLQIEWFGNQRGT
ncbi:MAG: 7-carboxy-7-deazaguanine synthase QueE [Planctomycetaceae bacterium]|nr:7-carboxy-7-deazaguanine synthase QueE [Planctomycetaceae bacterium]